MLEQKLKKCPYPNCNNEKEIKSDGGIGWCPECFNMVIACSCGVWNKAFANFCTRCPQKLQKPTSWTMAYGNPYKSSSITSAGNIRLNFPNWEKKLDEHIEDEGYNVPSIITADGLVIVPSLKSNQFYAYHIKDKNIKLRVPYNGKLSYSATPIFHGTSIFFAVEGEIRKASLIDSGTQEVETQQVIADNRIVLTDYCPPLIYKTNTQVLAIFGLKKHILIYDLKGKEHRFVEYNLDNNEDSIRMPVICHNKLILTSKLGKILTLNFEDDKLSELLPVHHSKDHYFSAPTVVSNKVYFQAIDLSNGHQRKMGVFVPTEDKVEFNNIHEEKVHNIPGFEKILNFPLLTNNSNIIVPSISGALIYISSGGILRPHQIRKGKFFLPYSISVGKRIYSVSKAGISLFDIGGLGDEVLRLTQTMGDNPLPISPPAVYGNKMFILCRDRLICHTIS